MTWFLIAIILGGILKFATNPPSALVAWILGKFELHPKLSSRGVSVTYNGKSLEDKEKLEFIKNFNEAVFLKKYFTVAGNESFFRFRK